MLRWKVLYASCTLTNFPKSSMSQLRVVCQTTSIGWRNLVRNLCLKSTLHLSVIILLGSLLLPFASNAAETSGNGRSLFVTEADEDNILPPDEAIKLSLEIKDAQNINANFAIAPGHYLYQQRFKFEVMPAANKVLAVDLPKGDIKQDPSFGQTEVYHHDMTARISLAKADSQPMKLIATYQGCSKKGLCYPPIHKTLDIVLPGITNAQAAERSANTSSNDEAASLLKSGKLWLIVLGFFGFGVLLSFTPCVLPMIPILSGIIVGGKHEGKLHTFNLSLAYTLGMALTYTLAGVAAGLSGQLLSNALQTPAVLITTALVFVLLAISMFGFYELKLPSAFESSMVDASNHLKGGKFIGVFVMGGLSALIVSPCVAAPLAGALLYISQTKDVVLGGTALFALSMGMGLPLLLIGASAGSLLPKTGPWMTSVRNFFGVVMLAVAVWILSPLISLSLQMALWAVLLIVPAIYLQALDRLPEHANQWKKFWKGIGVIILVVGVAMLIGALSGARSATQPLSGLMGGSSAVSKSKLPFQKVKNLAELKQQIETASASGKLVMLDFYADWCVACKELELYTFSDLQVQAKLGQALLLQADVTMNSAEDIALLQQFKLFGPPGVIFFDKSGQQTARVIGYKSAEDFLQTLNKLDI